MSLKHGLLGLLNYEPMTGYELGISFKVSLANFWHAKTQQIYRELNAMEQNGWLVSERVPQEDKPNRRVYTITDKGRKEFLDWLSSPEEDIKNSVRFKSVFFMRLFFAGETSREQALDLLYAYREQCLEGMEEMDNINEMLSKHEAENGYDNAIYYKLVALSGEMMRKARLEWVDKAISILKSLK